MIKQKVLTVLLSAGITGFAFSMALPATAHASPLYNGTGDLALGFSTQSSWMGNGFPPGTGGAYWIACAILHLHCV